MAQPLPNTIKGGKMDLTFTNLSIMSALCTQVAILWTMRATAPAFSLTTVPAFLSRTPRAGRGGSI